MTLTPPQAALLRDLLPEGREAQRYGARVRIRGEHVGIDGPSHENASADELWRLGFVCRTRTYDLRLIFTVRDAGREYASLNFPEVTP